MNAAAPQRAPQTRPDFAAAVVPLRGKLLRAAGRYTKNIADAEDLVQDVLAKACAAWPGYRPCGGDPWWWLHRILTNTFISGYRRRQRVMDREEQARAALYGDAEAARCRWSGPEIGTLGDDVVMALDDLEPPHLEVVVMADIQGLTYKEIAARLGLPPGTVMSRLSRARRQLEERLRDYAREAYGIGG